MKLISPPWARPGGLLHQRIAAFSTTRAGGVSAPPYDSLNLGEHVGDDPASVAENRALLSVQTRLKEPVRWLHQVHGSVVVEASSAAEPVEADAIVCRQPGVPIAIMTADCIPVLLAADDGSVVAAVHAGWRSLSADILAKTITAMDTPAARLVAWIGPGIGVAAYEVGDEMRDAFVARNHTATNCFMPNERGRWQADLKMLTLLALRREGLARVTDCGRCTYTDADDFFSHRRAAPCGRMASVIWIGPAGA
ncbi:MAG: peptidoglycan editing factor PgeF [Woeseiaceae bacterium]